MNWVVCVPRGQLSFLKGYLQNSVPSRVRGHMQSCGELREDGTFEENNLFF